MSGEYIKEALKLQSEIHQTAIDKGWWTKRHLLEEAALAHGGAELYQFSKITNQLAAMMLVVSEISEAAEALRKGNPPDDKIPQHSGVAAELADAEIRIADLSEAYGHKTQQAKIEKAEMNKGRPYMHGKKA